jgi:hypothetical protein
MCAGLLRAEQGGGAAHGGAVWHDLSELKSDLARRRGMGAALAAQARTKVAAK